MTPASKGSPTKRGSASRSTTASRSGNKSKPARVGATAGRRPALTKKKAAPVVKKAATATTKATSTAKKASSGAVKKTASTAKKSATTATKKAPAAKKAPAKKAAPTKKAAPVAKKAAPPAKKAAPPAKKAATSAAARAGNGAGAAPTPSRTAFTPKPKPPAPVRPKTGPYAKDAKFLEEVRELLVNERTIYQEQATSLRAEADSLALEREPGDVQFDEESGEGGTVTVDRERNLALSGQATLAVEEIDDAMARVNDKTYGYCERCFQPIPKPRLRALPYARLCVACKSGGLSRR